MRCQNRTDQRAGACDCGKMMAEDHPLIHGMIITAIAETMGWGEVIVAKREDFRQDKGGVKTISKRKDQKADDDKSEGVH